MLILKKASALLRYVMKQAGGLPLQSWCTFNPIALRKAKIVCNFGLSECNRVKHCIPDNPNMPDKPSYLLPDQNVHSTMI